VIGWKGRSATLSDEHAGRPTQTVPYGTDRSLTALQAINCLATIIQSLRDGKPSRPVLQIDSSPNYRPVEPSDEQELISTDLSRLLSAFLIASHKIEFKAHCFADKPQTFLMISRPRTKKHLRRLGRLMGRCDSGSFQSRSFATIDRSKIGQHG